MITIRIDGAPFPRRWVKRLGDVLSEREGRTIEAFWGGETYGIWQGNTAKPTVRIIAEPKAPPPPLYHWLGGAADGPAVS